MGRNISGHIRANAVAYLALFVALGGTAVASSVRLSANSVGTAQLKNGAVTGKKVAKDTLTGANIDVSRLGTVPSAADATNAATAQNATNATNAVNAQSAATAANAQNATNAVNAEHAADAVNASQLGGQAPSSFQSRITGACTSGTAVASIAAAGTVACQSTNVTQMMAGTPSLATAASTHYLAGEGLTPAPAPTTETDGVGASTLAGTAGNLDAGILSLLTLSTTFTLDVNESPTALTCTIPPFGGTCHDSADTVSIPAGALVDIAVQGSSGTATQMAVGWTYTTSG